MQDYHRLVELELLPKILTIEQNHGSSRVTTFLVGIFWSTERPIIYINNPLS
jgi:hypothetical protein